MQAIRSVGCVIAILFFGIVAPSVACAEPEQLRLGVFDVDATPPVGMAMAYGPAARPADLQLRCRGIVILGAAEPIVLCAIDWIGVGNAAHDAFREALAKAAATTPDRVAVQAVHQHDAPHADFTAESIVAAAKTPANRRFDGGFARQVIGRAAEAVRGAVGAAGPVTHYGFGRAEVREVASNRRLIGADGRLRGWRGSATLDPALRAEPEGLVDPFVTALVFYDGDVVRAVLTAYACHPQSYYRTGTPGPDFPGIARFIRTQDLPSALHVHFAGAGGNVAAGKYNDGSHGNRVTLALRLATGMRQAFEAVVKQPLTPADVGWSSVPVRIAARRELDAGKLEVAIREAADRGTYGPAEALAWMSRAQEGHRLDISCLRIGTVRMLHMPGELFVEYQLAAHRMRPDLDVMLAAYGDLGPGSIGTAASYGEGGYEVAPTSSFVGPDAEEPLTAAMRTLLQAEADGRTGRAYKPVPLKSLVRSN